MFPPEISSTKRKVSGLKSLLVARYTSCIVELVEARHTRLPRRADAPAVHLQFLKHTLSQIHDHRISIANTVEDGEPFVAYIDLRFLLSA